MGDRLKWLTGPTPQATKTISIAIVEQQQDLSQGDKNVYKKFTDNMSLIRTHLGTFDSDFQRTRGRMIDAFKLLEKYIKKDFYFYGPRTSAKFTTEEQLFFIDNSELVVRGVVARVVLPEKFKEDVPELDVLFYVNTHRKLSMHLAPPPSKEVVMLAMNRVEAEFESIIRECRNEDQPVSNFADDRDEESELNDKVSEDPVEFIQSRLMALGIDETTSTSILTKSDEYLDLARRLQSSMHISRSSSPPRENWEHYVKSEVVQEDDIYEPEYKTYEPDGGYDPEYKETETNHKPRKRVRFAKINLMDDGLFEPVKEMILFNTFANVNFLIQDNGTHLGMKIDVNSVPLTDFVKKENRDISATKQEKLPEKVAEIHPLRPLPLREVIEHDVALVCSPTHIDLQPVDMSNVFDEDFAEAHFEYIVKHMRRFSSNWKGIDRRASRSDRTRSENSVFGVLIITDSLLEDIDPRYFLNAHICSLPPPLTLDDMLHVLENCEYEQLNVREVVISFGHDVLTYIEEVSENELKEGVRKTIEAVDRVEAIFKKRREQYLEKIERNNLDSSKIEILELPRYAVLTIPEFGSRATIIREYNNLLRRVINYAGNCTLIDWAGHGNEHDRDFRSNCSYEDRRRYIERRVTNLAKLLKREVYLLHFRQNHERGLDCSLPRPGFDCMV